MGVQYLTGVKLKHRITDLRDKRIVQPVLKCLTFTLVIAACALAVQRSAGLAGVTGPGPDYVLGAQDKIRVKVFEWRPSRDELFEWSALNT